MLQGALNPRNNNNLTQGVSALMQKNLIVGILAMGYFFVVSTLSIPARLLVRKNMGERAFTIPNFLITMTAYALFSGVVFFLFIAFIKFGLFVRLINSHVFELSNFSFSSFLLNLILFLISPFTVFFILILGLALSHFKRHLERARRKIVGYSFYRGDGIYFNHKLGGEIFGFKINDRVLRMIVEPLQLFKMSWVTLVLSILVLILRAYYPADNVFFLFVDSLTFGVLAVSFTIIISSTALFLEEFAIMQKGRDAILDMIDGELDMQQIMVLKEGLKIENPKSLDEGQEG